MGGCGGQTQDPALTQSKLLRWVLEGPLWEGFSQHLPSWGLPEGEERSKAHGEMAGE